MKKVLMCIVVTILLFTLVACDGDYEGSGANTEKMELTSCGYFISLKDAYIQKLINEDDVKTIEYYFNNEETTEEEFTPTVSIENGISEETVEDIQTSKAYDMNETIEKDSDKLAPSNIKVRYLGNYYNCIAVETKQEGKETTGEVINEEVAEVIVEHDSSIEIELWKSNEQGRIDTNKDVNYHEGPSPTCVTYIISEKTKIKNDEELVIKFVYKWFDCNTAIVDNGFRLEIIQQRYAYTDEAGQYHSPYRNDPIVYKEYSKEELERLFTFGKWNFGDIRIFDARIFEEYVTLSPELFNEKEGALLFKKQEVKDGASTNGIIAVLNYRKVNDEIYLYNNTNDYYNNINQ